MSNVQPPPITNEIVDENQVTTMPWALFFNQLFVGDTGTSWTPTFTSLTEVGGAATITGRYYKLSQELTFFSVTVTPVTNTSATAGTTYINNFPLIVSTNGFCIAVSGNLGTNAGMVVQGNNRIYVPGWAAVTIPLTIIGLVEAK